MIERTTEACLAAIRNLPAGQEGIVAATFTPFYGRAQTSAAFRMAKARKLIESHETSYVGNPIYRRTEN